MPAPLAAAVVAAIARAAVSNAAKKRLMQAAAKKVSEKDIKALIRTEMKTGGMDLGRANRIPGPSNPPKRLVENRTGSGVKSGAKPEKRDPAKDIFNLYKNEPGVKKSVQKVRVTPEDVIAQRIAASKAKPRVGKSTSAKAAKKQKPAKSALTEEARIKAKGSAVRSKSKGATKVETDEPQGYWIKGKKKGDPREWVSTEGDAGLMPRSGSNPTIASREKAPKDTPNEATTELTKLEYKLFKEADEAAAENLKKIARSETAKKAEELARIAAAKVKKASPKDKAAAIAAAKKAAKRAEELRAKAKGDVPQVPRRTIEEAIRNARQQRSGTTPAQKAHAKRTEIAKGKLTQAQLNEIKKIAARIKKAGQ
jgi:hypothetical protein